MKRAIATLITAIVLGATPVVAADLAPNHARLIDLGALKGVAYYTVEEDGFHVVATVADDDSKAVRFEARLAEGQSVQLTTPSEAGAVKVELSRQNGSVQVQSVPATH